MYGGTVGSQDAQRLPGMRDLFEEENRRSRRVQDGLQSFLALYGYRIVDTPVVEPTDIFLRKSAKTNTKNPPERIPNVSKKLSKTELAFRPYFRAYFESLLPPF